MTPKSLVEKKMASVINCGDEMARRKSIDGVGWCLCVLGHFCALYSCGFKSLREDLKVIVLRTFKP